MKIVVICLGIKPARHFSFFDRQLLESKHDLKYFVITSTERIEKYGSILPSGFEHITSTWTPHDQSSFNKGMLLFRTISSQLYRTHSMHWLRYFFMGNQVNRVNFKLILQNIYFVVRFVIKFMHSPLPVIFSEIPAGTISSNAIKFPESDKKKMIDLFSRENPDLVLIQSTLSDLSLYNVLTILEKLSLPSILIVDSWDNIGSRPVLPKEVQRYLVQSSQQSYLAKKVYGLESEKVTLFGTPRISQVYRTKLSKNEGVLRIGYLQGLPADDLEINLRMLEKSVNCFLKHQILFSDYLIEIRGYPIKAEKAKINIGCTSEAFSQKVKVQSPSESLLELFRESDVIVSEITTAGIEAACFGMPTIFIASNSQRIYLNGTRILRSFHSSDLESRGFSILKGIDSDEDCKNFHDTFHGLQKPDLGFFVYTDENQTITERLIEEIGKSS